MLDRQKGHAGTWRIYECACESRMCHVCVFTSDLQSRPAKEERLSVLMFMSVLYVDAVEGSTLSVAGCVAGTISVLCVCVCLRDALGLTTS